MSRCDGGLRSGIQTYLKYKTSRKFGVLIIDEQSEDKAPNPRSVAQLQILALAIELKMKVVLVEINPPMRSETRRPTKSILTGNLPDDTEVFFKVGFNAFGRVDGTGQASPSNKGASLLDASLRQAGVNELIIMGRVGQQCVRLTAVGGPERKNAPPIDGATGFGYQVWTCPQVIDSGDSGWLNWYDQRGVKCFVEP